MSCLDCNNAFDKDTMNLTKIPLPLQMSFPLSPAPTVCALSYDGNVIILFNTKTNEAWSMDIGNDSNEWIKTDFVFPKFEGNRAYALDAVVGKDNDIYFISTYRHLFCIKMSLNDIIPRDILNRYSKTLVYGFIRQQLFGLSVPSEIIELFAIFYVSS